MAARIYSSINSGKVLCFHRMQGMMMIVVLRSCLALALRVMRAAAAGRFLLAARGCGQHVMKGAFSSLSQSSFRPRRGNELHAVRPSEAQGRGSMPGAAGQR